MLKQIIAISALGVLCFFFSAPVANAQYYRSYKSGSNNSTSKGDVILRDDQTDWDVAFGFGQSTYFEVEVADGNDGTEPTYCTNSNHDYDASAASSTDPYYPTQVLYSTALDYGSNAMRYIVVGDTEDGSITTTSCGTRNGFISAVEFSSTCGTPALEKSVIFGITGYTIEMRDAWDDGANNDVFFTGVATACSGGKKKMFIGKLDVDANPAVLTARLLTVTESSTEVEFQPKALVVDADNIYVGGTYKGWPADAFIMSIDRDALLATGAPTNPTTVLRTLFDGGSGDQSAIQDLEIHGGYIYAVGQWNATFSGTSDASGFIIGLKTNLDVVSGYEYTKSGSATQESFRGIAHAGDGEFLVSGHTDGFTVDKDIMATRFHGYEGYVYPQVISSPTYLGNNVHIYENAGESDVNLNITTCDNGSHVTIFNKFTNTSIDNQLVIHTNNDLTMPADKDNCFTDVVMDILPICSDIDDNRTVTTTHSNMSEDATISFSRDNDNLGTEVCSTTQGCLPFQGNQTNVYETSNVSDLDNVSVYPNPGSGLFNVKSADEIQTIRVYTTSGLLIQESEAMTTDAQIDLSSFKPGQYLVQVITTEGSFEKSLIKE